MDFHLFCCTWLVNLSFDSRRCVSRIEPMFREVEIAFGKAVVGDSYIAE